MIRVFPRKTKWTPTDDLAFYGGPPLYDLPDMPVAISVTFTWDKMRGEQLLKEWSLRNDDVGIGGPAYGGFSGGEFVPGRFIKEGVTITSRGCPKNCPWCLVPQGQRPKELIVQPGHIIQDDNLLACTTKHIEQVFEMLKWQTKAVEFKGGLDIDYLMPWHIDLLKTLTLKSIWVAFDTDDDLNYRLQRANDLLADFDIEKRRCYVLVGFKDDTPEKAIRRCEKIYDHDNGFLPFAQYYQPPAAHSRVVPKEWRFVVWKWSRPGAYRPKKEKAANGKNLPNS